MTEKNLENNYQIETPFSELNAIKILQTQVPEQWISNLKKGGSNFSYVSGDVVIRMLNKAFRNRWSFEVVETREVQGQDKVDKSGKVYPQGKIIQVLGRLTVPGWGTREQWGAQPLLGGSDVQEHAFKSATTDAMKKCASMFGVALDLYGTQGKEHLLIDPRDYLLQDERQLDNLKESILKQIDEAKANVESKKEAPLRSEPNEIELKTMTDTEAPEEVQVEPTIEVHSEVSVAKQVATAPAEESVTPEPAPSPVSPEIKPNNAPLVWKTEDIEDMRWLMASLNLQKNTDLDPYVQEFTRLPEASIAKHITPINARDFITYMKQNHLNK